MQPGAWRAAARPTDPAEYGSYREARTDTISQVKVSTLSGEPRRTPVHGGVADDVGAALAVLSRRAMIVDGADLREAT
jgi:hypothetical protein